MNVRRRNLNQLKLPKHHKTKLPQEAPQEEPKVIGKVKLKRKPKPKEPNKSRAIVASVTFTLYLFFMTVRQFL